MHQRGSGWVVFRPGISHLNTTQPTQTPAAVVRHHGPALVTVRTARQEPASGLLGWSGTYSLSVTVSPPCLGCSLVSGSVKPVPRQQARFAAGADHRHGAACLVEQVADLAEIAGAVLAQQRGHVRVRQPGPGQLLFLELAAGDQDPG